MTDYRPFQQAATDAAWPSEITPDGDLLTSLDGGATITITPAWLITLADQDGAPIAQPQQATDEADALNRYTTLLARLRFIM